MSYIPPPGGMPPPGGWPPPGTMLPPGTVPPSYYGNPPQMQPMPMPGAYAYVPMMPVPMPTYPQPPPEPEQPSHTYVTNYIYQPQPPPHDQVQVVDDCNMIDWMPSNMTVVHNLSGRAVVAGRETLSGSPLWVIRSRYGGECIPGKLVAKYNTAYISFGGKEIRVYDYEVLLAPSHMVQWLPASNGSVPVGAIPAGNTEGGEPLYIGRARHLFCQTPGKVHGTHGCCYIPFSGFEISYRNYEVLCKI